MSSNPNRIALIERREASTCFIVLGSLVYWFMGSLLYTYHLLELCQKLGFSKRFCISFLHAPTRFLSFLAILALTQLNG